MDTVEVALVAVGVVGLVMIAVVSWRKSAPSAGDRAHRLRQRGAADTGDET